MPGVASPDLDHADRPSLPAGTYLTISRGLRLGKGGRTAAMLMRAHMLGTLGGRRSLLVTYDDYDGYDEVRDALVARGLLRDRADLVNLFEDYRTRTPERLGTGSEPLPSLVGTAVRDDPRPDADAGTPVPATRSHLAEDGSVVAVDHLRPDGSVFLRVPVDHASTPYYLVDHEGRVVRRSKRRAGLVRSWLRELAPTGEVFAVTDSRFTVRILLGLSSRRFRVLEVVHNPHTTRDFRWDRPVQPTFQGVFERLAELDGLVLLTDRQRHDVGLRFGPTNNLFTVHNPVWIPADEQDRPRARAHFVVIARLEGQKRVAHALDALAIASRASGDLSLSVYGDGREREALEEHAAQLGVREKVTFHGHDPQARASLVTATALLVTSRHEGYPLATLEAMSHGCPVVGYDVRYGMREQVTDGENGYLVPDGDVEALAARMLALADDPSLVERMSDAARRRAEEHTPEHLIGLWARVFTRVRDQAVLRTEVSASALTAALLGERRRLPFRPERLEVDARVRLAGTGPRPGPGTVSASLDVIDDATGEVVSTSLRVSATQEGIRVRGAAPVAALRSAFGDRPVRARLVVVWQNSARLYDLASGGIGDLQVSGSP